MYKFEIVTKTELNKKLKHKKRAGISIYKETEELYKIHLNIFPNIPYYIKKSKNNDYYRIYSKVVGKGKDVKLLNFVGNGKVLRNLKTHMKLYFEALNMTLYMSLYPER